MSDLVEKNITQTVVRNNSQHQAPIQFHHFLKNQHLKEQLFHHQVNHSVNN